jgi:hypothetical protein
MNRTAILATATAAALAATLAGCDIVPQDFGGTPVTETRAVAPFTAVELRGQAVVTVVSSSDYALTVRADSTKVDAVHTSVIGDTLVITEDDKATTGRVEISIHAPQIESVEMLGAGTITVTGLKTDRFAVAVAGAGDVTVSGQTSSLVTALSGVGSIDARSLHAVDVTARMSGVGSITVNATSTLDAQLSGVGDIHYTGDPTVTSSVSGAGDITHD